MTWYLRSMAHHDTHRGTLSRGMVDAACRIRFKPLRLALGRTALPGLPPDPAQICATCYRANRARPA